MKRVWSLLLAAVLLLGAGCHGETEQNRYENPVQRYYLYQDETTGEYAGALGAMGSEAAEFEEDVAAYIQDYLEGPESPELRTPFPVGTSLEKCTLEDGTEQRVELPVLEEDGTVSALITVFTQAWSLDVEVEREGGDVPVSTGFIVIP